ncbi:hypothetical protein THRCLA_04917 [Thraustotheca clavata]|uniref:Uncharacterized protein n=1 Tax=Thraustotheca clavata TaxID=74557 RepID=A0A1V9ZXL4_9STRA|nr:hypothetical protein THRCLA_04917 [Thraustotheca clavata]
MTEAQVYEQLKKDMEEDHALKAALMKFIGIDQESLSNTSQKYVGAMAQAASVLELNSIETSAFVAGITDVWEKHHELIAAKRTWQRHEKKQLERMKILDEEVKEAMEMYHVIEKALKERDVRENIGTMDGRIDEYVKKQNVYNQEITKLDETLHKRQIFEQSAFLQHQTLIDLQAKNVSIESDNQTLQSKLSRYENLPPNLEMANATLYEAQELLRRLENEFQSRIQNMV